MFEASNHTYILYLVGLAGLLQACLQLPAASLLHMVTHSLGKNKRGHAAGLTIAMVLGVFLSTALLFSLASLLVLMIPGKDARLILTGIAMTFAGLFIMLRYFRELPGAQLWLSRRSVRWLHHQIEDARGFFAAFGISMVAVLLEIWLAFPLMIGASVMTMHVAGDTALAALAIYSTVAIIPLLLIGLSIWLGASPLTFQRWRSTGRQFWQFFIGFAIILFGLYIASGQYLGGSA